MTTQPDRQGGDGLLPCPFCGSAPKCNGQPGGVMGQIYCANADCFGPKTTASWQQESVKQWNTRATLQPTRDAAEGAGNNSDGLCPVPPARTSAVSTQTACETEGVSSDHSAAARRVSDSESIGSLASVIAASQCENGVSPGPSETVRSIAAQALLSSMGLQYPTIERAALSNDTTWCDALNMVDVVASAIAAAATPKPAPDAVRDLLSKVRPFVHYMMHGSIQDRSKLAREIDNVLSAPALPADEIERLRKPATPQPAPNAVREATLAGMRDAITLAAVIADPWPDSSDDLTEVDQAVVAVRKKIAAAIRAIVNSAPVPSPDGTGEHGIQCALCGETLHDNETCDDAKCPIGGSFTVVSSATGEAEPVAVSDVDWERALRCAASCLQGVPVGDIDNAMQHAFGILSLRQSVRGDREHAVFWYNEALENVAQIVLQWKADPAIAFDIRALKSDSLPVQPGAGEREAAQALINALDLGIYWAQEGGRSGVGLTKIAACNAVKIITDAKLVLSRQPPQSSREG